MRDTSKEPLDSKGQKPTFDFLQHIRGEKNEHLLTEEKWYYLQICTAIYIIYNTFILNQVRIETLLG